jgi:hypothetical protein
MNVDVEADRKVHPTFTNFYFHSSIEFCNASSLYSVTHEFHHTCTVMVKLILSVNYLSDCLTSLARFPRLFKNDKLDTLTGQPYHPIALIRAVAALVLLTQNVTSLQTCSHL